ncbi:MAG: T9SS type A sorting domain-containing protein [Bacteroidia bacterium]
MRLNYILLSLSLLSFSSYSQVGIVKDIQPGSAPSMPSYANNRVAYNGKLIFAAYPSSGTRMELYITDGTNSGTALLKNIGGSSYSSNPQGFSVSNNRVYFSASTTSIGYEPYISDGTSNGTVLLKKVKFSGVNGSYPYYFTELGTKTLFKATDNAGAELFVSDGTTAGTTLVSDIYTGSSSSNPGPFFKIGSYLYFAANYANGRELFRVSCPNSCSAILWKDINPGTASSNPSNFALFNGNLHFSANNGSNGNELWLTNGTSSTYMLADINSGSSDSDPAFFVPFAGQLYFAATNGSNGRELFRVNNLGNVTLVKDIVSGSSSSNPEELIVFNNKLYFTASDANGDRELYVSDGTNNGTVRVKDINSSGSSSPEHYIVYGNELIFVADDGVHGKELWRTDGTSNGTWLLSDINTTTGSNPRDLILANNLLFFTANDGIAGEELWKYKTCIQSTSSITASACESYSSPSGNFTWTSSGIYTDRLSNANYNGCDSVITVNLTINTSQSGTDQVEACDSFKWIDGITYYADNNSATFTINAGASNGCDSLVSLDLKITNVDRTVIQSGNSLSIQQNNGTYRWLDCDSNYKVISGENKQTFTPTKSGNYAADIGVGNCLKRSDCIYYKSVGLIENKFSSLSMYPVPNTGELKIEIGEKVNKVSIDVFNSIGQIVFQDIFFDTSLITLDLDKASGFYTIEVKINDTYSKKMKLIIEN